jgi:hypothetical protein
MLMSLRDTASMTAPVKLLRSNTAERRRRHSGCETEPAKLPSGNVAERGRKN